MVGFGPTIETDVLIVGGGIAGLMAAIHAGRLGAKVVIAEKADTRRSGSGSTGNDHFLCYIPYLHGELAPYMEECLETLVGKYQDKNLMHRHLEDSFDRVQDWESWGIEMRPTGDWEFVGHAIPGRTRTHLKYAGAHQKKILTREAQKSGAVILNKLPVMELLIAEGRAVGALALNIREKSLSFQIIRAKSVVLATGNTSRLYVPVSPGWIFNTPFCPSCAGAGRAAALRAGARLVNMELPYTHAGPKYLARCGKATWIGVLRDSRGEPVGPFVREPDKLHSDPTADIWNSVFTDMYKSGQGPVFMDCSGISPEDYQYMMWAFVHEGNTAMLNHMADEGLDPREHMVEFTRYAPDPVNRGIEIDENAATSVPGLFAASDEVGNFCAFIAGAATYGWIAGRSAADYAGKINHCGGVESHEDVWRLWGLCRDILERESGPGWKEANLALQQIMTEYAGKEVRSQSLLEAGLSYLRGIKAKARAGLAARGVHHLMRCLEVLDLIEIGETIFVAALERKETRGAHLRSDFPYKNPYFNNKFLNVWQEKGELRLAWRNQIM